ncbi:hypothetical protein GCM10009116_04710 [Brevundimonas basaltis]|uniref:Secreted protein n=1 Tax=Brevundimonas basaltis TaxID=472166 RepID=A0A7W8MH99_9CAUL|nr:hypothetical protein [Brevundimonas basaltis]MBB5292740.1 hypothetical protein [Brevundimonas basaltis]
MKRLMIIAALLAAACQPLPADDSPTGPAERPADRVVDEVGTTDVPPPVRVPENAAAADCLARGGKMLPQGRMQTLQCVISYSDGGTRCTDGDQCQGSCRIPDAAAAPRAGAAAVGQCQPTSSAFGCYTTVEDGKAQATICVD